MTLPATSEQVDESSFEYPGAMFPGNRMGALTTVLLDLMQGIPVQDNIDGAFADGTVRHLYVIHSADPSEDDPQVSITFYSHVEDGDDDPTNNLDGDSPVRIPVGAVGRDMGDNWRIEDGVLIGNGGHDFRSEWTMRYLTGVDPLSQPSLFPHLRANMTEDEIVGSNGGVISPQMLEEEIYPYIAGMLSHAMDIGSPRSDQLAGIYDANGDGTVTAEEIATNDVMASLTSPDVDIDGDDVFDHISQGALFRAVRVQVVE